MFSYFTEPANKECKNIESAANYARHPTPPMEERAPKSSRRGPSSTQRKIRCPEFADYGAEILEMMFAQQLKSTVTPEYMQLQPELTWPMRETLIRWLIQVHAEYNLQQESLYLAIHIIDRISSIRRIAKDQYQLLGTTALWVASKYEENHGRVPTLKNLAFICMQRYREADFVQTERLILESLKFDLSHPTPEAFLRTLWAERLLVADDVQTSDRLNAEIRSVARYLMEIGTVAGPDGFFVACSSSMIATAALQLAEEICLPPSMTSSYLATYNPPLPSEAAARAKECYNVLALCVGKGCEVVRNKVCL
ncbi:hypothetical protein HKX48_008517 [Thoreauomyces humboldtii]|nr:hypothetical protein HKX48_008517 [Thoreauomyces humboldtii]